MDLKSNTEVMNQENYTDENKSEEVTVDIKSRISSIEHISDFELPSQRYCEK